MCEFRDLKKIAESPTTVRMKFIQATIKEI